ncbi:hypothetical protein GCM10009534_35110 [Kribbella sandramycini]
MIVHGVLLYKRSGSGTLSGSVRADGIRAMEVAPREQYCSQHDFGTVGDADGSALDRSLGVPSGPTDPPLYSLRAP